jgi:hypothetical protein
MGRKPWAKAIPASTWGWGAVSGCQKARHSSIPSIFDRQAFNCRLTTIKTISSLRPHWLAIRLKTSRYGRIIQHLSIVYNMLQLHEL